MYEKDLRQFAFYGRMSEADQKLLRDTVLRKELEKGQIIFGDNQSCTGIPLVAKGTLRLFRISDKGREMTLYRVTKGEMCILAAVCAMGDVEYDFSIEAEEDAVLETVPPDVFRKLMNESEVFKTYVFNTLAEKLILSIETIEMLIFVSIEDRIMEYVLDNADASGVLKITHEKLAIDLGSSREVITRQLKKMADKNMLSLSRGKIILN